MKIILNRTAAGPDFAYQANEMPQEIPDDVAQMLLALKDENGQPVAIDPNAPVAVETTVSEDGSTTVEVQHYHPKSDKVKKK